MHRGLGRLHGVMLVMHGRCRTGQIVDFINFDEKRETDIMTQELEPRMLVQMFDVALRAGEQIVHTQDVMPLIQKPVDQVRAEK